MSKPKTTKRKSISKGGAKKSALLNTPYTNSNQYLPRFYIINDEPTEIIKPFERRTQIQLGRELFAKMPLVSSAILNKNHIAVGNAWQPTFTGTIRHDKDKSWVAGAEKWLVNDYYKNCNWNGANFTFSDTLFLTGKDIDVDGSSMMVFKNDPITNAPKIQLIPSDRVGSRVGETIVNGGAYNGLRIFDGLVYNKDNTLVAYKILGSKPEDDVIISVYNCQYLYEPAWTQYGHGISRISYSVTNLMDVQDVTDLLKITIKNQSALAIIHKNSKGAAPKGKRIYGTETPNNEANTNQNKVFYQDVNKGATQYISSLDGSDITPFQFSTPSLNTENFLYRISSEAIGSMGWDINMVLPDKISGASVRSIQDKCRKLIVWRQQTIERRAKAIVQYGLAKAMENGILPKTDNKEWLNWTFTKPAQLSIDNGYDNQAQIESLKMGIATKQEICSQRGKDWMDVSNQSEKELRDLFTRAQQLAKDFNMTEAEAREWLSKRDIDNLAPIVTQPIVTKE